jgi:hypothetical protein
MLLQNGAQEKMDAVRAQFRTALIATELYSPEAINTMVDDQKFTLFRHAQQGRTYDEPYLVVWLDGWTILPREEALNLPRKGKHVRA